MMTNEQIWQIAREQSAWDIGCRPEDFLKNEPVVVALQIGPCARKYFHEPMACDLVCYGGNVVAAVKEEYRALVEEAVKKFDFYRLFETPGMHWLNEGMEPLGQKVCFMAEYFLPDVRKMKPLTCQYELKILTQPDFANLYTDQWSNALCADRKELDVLGVGAYDGERLIGLAACSADGEKMWQIGEDVLPEYRNQGIASAMVSHLAMEIMNRGKVPFYCCAWSNIRSARTAIKCGFVPAWAELTVKPKEFVDAMNG